jgi:hypothetical protein
MLKLILILSKHKKLEENHYEIMKLFARFLVFLALIMIIFYLPRDSFFYHSANSDDYIMTMILILHDTFRNIILCLVNVPIMMVNHIGRDIHGYMEIQLMGARLEIIITPLSLVLFLILFVFHRKFIDRWNTRSKYYCSDKRAYILMLITLFVFIHIFVISIIYVGPDTFLLLW